MNKGINPRWILQRFPLQAARASSSVQSGEIWRISVVAAKTVQWTSTTGINVSIVASKNASRWECGRRVSRVFYCLKFFISCFSSFHMIREQKENSIRKIPLFEFLSPLASSFHNMIVCKIYPTCLILSILMCIKHQIERNNFNLQLCA